MFENIRSVAVQVSLEEKLICAGFQIYNIFDIPLSSWDSDCSIARAIFSHLIGNLWCGSYFQHKQSNYLEQFHFTQQCREVMMNTNEKKSHCVLCVSVCVWLYLRRLDTSLHVSPELSWAWSHVWDMCPTGVACFLLVLIFSLFLCMSWQLLWIIPPSQSPLHAFH